MDLATRAAAFLRQPLPADLDYVPGSLAELILSACAEGRLDSDPELLDLAELCRMETLAAAEEGSDERRAYFRESAAILQAILDRERSS